MLQDIHDYVFFSIREMPMKKYIMPLFFFNYTEVKVRRLLRPIIFSAIVSLTFLHGTKVAHANTADRNDQNLAPFVSMNGQAPICKEISKLLILPENKDYISSLSDQFNIPSSHQFFSQPIWKKSSEADFKSILPEEYKRLTTFLAKENRKIKEVKYFNSDVFNRGKKDKIFKVDASDKSFLYLVPESYRRGYERFFLDNDQNSQMILFQEKPYFARKQPNYLEVRSYKQREGNPPVELVCKFKFR